MPIRFADIAWPGTRRFWLANARVPACTLAGVADLATPADAEGVVNADLLIEDGKLARVEPPSGKRDDRTEYVDLGGRQIWPTLIDIHTHLDKGHTVDRSPNVDGTFLNARLAAAADRPNWTVPFCVAAWISACAAPTLTACRRSALISIPIPRLPSEAGKSSARCTATGKTRSTFRRWRYVRSICSLMSSATRRRQSSQSRVACSAG